MKLQPEGNSWKLCIIGGCAYENGTCFNCGKRADELDNAYSRIVNLTRALDN